MDGALKPTLVEEEILAPQDQFLPPLILVQVKICLFGTYFAGLISITPNTGSIWGNTNVTITASVLPSDYTK